MSYFKSLFGGFKLTLDILVDEEIQIIFSKLRFKNRFQRFLLEVG